MNPEPKPGILDITPYVPGAAKAPGVERPVKLSANENPLGCSELARLAYLDAVGELHLYPDAKTSRLRAALAQKYALEPERLVFGAGSDEIFAMACQAYLGPGDNMVQPQFGFAAWAIAARAAGGVVKSAKERDHFIDVDALLGAVDRRTRVVFIANPANPTGTWIPFGEVERLHRSLPENVLLVLDGAYAECAFGLAGFSAGIEWSRDKENVLITRTFSKVYGLASLRIGWAYAPVRVAEALNRIRLPFSVSRAGEAAAVAALADTIFLERSLDTLAKGRARLREGLLSRGASVLPSAANFITASFDHISAAEIATNLARLGVLVRHLHNYGLPDWLRISVGTEAELTTFFDALDVTLQRP